MSPSISIITVVFNNSSSIADCIRSIADQSHPGINHIIIDGGSTDGTMEIIKEWQQANKLTSQQANKLQATSMQADKRQAGKRTLQKTGGQAS